MNTAGNKALETLPVVIKLDEFLEINYALLEAPKFTSTYIETQHKGEIFLATDPVEAPFSPLPLPPVADTSSKMVYVWITDYVANTAGLVYQKAGKLQYKITPEMVSEQKTAECLNSLLRNCVLNSVHIVVAIAHMLVNRLL